MTLLSGLIIGKANGRDIVVYGCPDYFLRRHWRRLYLLRCLVSDVPVDAIFAPKVTGSSAYAERIAAGLHVK